MQLSVHREKSKTLGFDFIEITISSKVCEKVSNELCHELPSTELGTLSDGSIYQGQSGSHQDKQ